MTTTRCTSMRLLLIISLALGCIAHDAPGNPTANQSDPRASEVVMVSWGTHERVGNKDEYSESLATGLYCTYKGLTGVLTNFHVLPEKQDATNHGGHGKHGKIHFEYVGPKQMSIPDMQHTGIDMQPDVFYYNGGKEASESDWAFVSVDANEVKRQYPYIKPYDLSQTAWAKGETCDALAGVCRPGDKVTMYHHRGGEPRLKWETTVLEDDTGYFDNGHKDGEGTLDHLDMCTVTRKGEGYCGGEAPNHGSSGSPIWLGDKVIGVFWGELGVETTTTTTASPSLKKFNRFATIQSVLCQLDKQLNAEKPLRRWESTPF